MTTTFTDVPTNRDFYTEIEWTARAGLLRGWSDGTFRPNSPIGRYAMAAVFYRLSGEPHYVAPAVSELKDVRVGQDFYKEIHWVKNRGLLNGWNDGTFRPYNNITRDQTAVLMYRAAGSPEFELPAASPFADVAPTHVFYTAICWMASKGITQGWTLSNGTKVFRPDATTTRDTMAAFLYRFDHAV